MAMVSAKPRLGVEALSDMCGSFSNRGVAQPDKAVLRSNKKPIPARGQSQPCPFG